MDLVKENFKLFFSEFVKFIKDKAEIKEVDNFISLIERELKYFEYKGFLCFVGQIKEKITYGIKNHKPNIIHIPLRDIKRNSKDRVRLIISQIIFPALDNYLSNFSAYIPASLDKELYDNFSKLIKKDAKVQD